MSRKVSYSKLFAPPKFLERRAVAVEILPAGIAYLLEGATSQGLLPEQNGLIPLLEGAILEGEVIKKDVIVKALAEIRRRMQVHFVRFSVPEAKTYIFKIHLPVLADKEIRDILDFKIEENVPLAAKDAVFDYNILPNSVYSAGLEVVVSVTPLKFIEEWQEIFSLAGLTPVSFSPESNNVAKSVIKENNEQVVVVANIRDNSIILSLVIYGVVCQTASLNFGSSTFTDLLAKYLNITPAEAIKIKREKLYSENDDNMEIFSHLINTISAIKDEIYKFVAYSNQREDVVGQVDRIILCGQDALIVGLDKYLEMNLQMDVSIANIWVNNFDIDSCVPKISHQDSLGLANLNGLNLL